MLLTNVYTLLDVIFNIGPLISIMTINFFLIILNILHSKLLEKSDLGENPFFALCKQ
jgi:hypothetical protein